MDATNMCTIARPKVRFILAKHVTAEQKNIE